MKQYFVWISIFLSANLLLALEYEKFLPNYLTEIGYPEKSKIANFQPTKDKKVIYFAAFHTNDFESIERKTIKKLLFEEKPDLCILEGFPTSEGLSPQWLVETAKNLYSKKIGGENTYAAYFCDELNIPFIGGEVDDTLFFSGLVEKGHSKKDIVFYMLLQQIPYWDRDGQLNGDNSKEQFEAFMHNQIADWFKMTIDYTYEDFLDWYAQHYNKTYDSSDFTWQVGRDHSWTDRRPSAYIHQKIGADCMNVRDNFIIKTILSSSEKYNKILVIFGAGLTGSHYEWQKKALTSFLGEAKETVIN